jgi:hypothetical protein
VSEDEVSEKSYEATHILSDDVGDDKGFVIDPTPNFFGGNLKALEANLPRERSIFDIFFDIEINDWLHWDTLRTVTFKEKGFNMRLVDS